MLDLYVHDTLTINAIKLVISSCLLGENVRYDGHNKRNSFIIGTLVKNLDVLPVCPEVGIGLSVPRPAIQLVQFEDRIHAVGVKEKSHDVTYQLEDYATKLLRQHPDLCGAVLTSKSPSCGVESTKLYTSNGCLIRENSSGIFAQKLINDQPGLPIVNDDKLDDTQSRVIFIMQVYAYARFKHALGAENQAESLYELHQCYYPLFLSLSKQKAMLMDKLILGVMENTSEERVNQYKLLFLQTLKISINRNHLSDFIRTVVKQYLKPINDASFEQLNAELQHFSDGLQEWPTLLAKLDEIAGSVVTQKNQLFSAGHWLVPGSESLIIE